MTGARLDGPLSREQTILDAREMQASGSPIGEVAKRLGVPVVDLSRWLLSETHAELRRERTA